MDQAALGRSGHGGVVKEENSTAAESSGGDDSNFKGEALTKVGNGRGHHANFERKPSSPEQKDLTRKKQNDKLESARAEMVEAKEENQRLKMYLDKIMKDYQALQMKFHDIVQQEARKSTDKESVDQETEETELVSLSLGRIASDSKKVVEKSQLNDDKKATKEGLSLGLDCKFEGSKSGASESVRNVSPGNSSEEAKEEAGETWPPSKVLKTMRSGDDEVAAQPVKKARVCVRARCDAPTMNDGCQWRKYGQKIAKGNPCPRAYYRCTVAPSCPVRKQVQRCAEDMSILITTYEGTHNHPLPMSATAMASTTSAAASMLLSGSSSSQSGLNPSTNPATSSTNIHGLNFYLSDNLRPRQLYLPNSSLSSTSPALPTITLDLTSTPSSSSSPINRIFSNFPSAAPRYPSTNLNFSSSESNPLSWGSGVLNYGTQPYSKSQIGIQNLGRNPMENIYHSLFLRNSNPGSTPPSQSLPDTVAAATKAIAADPSFQSALAAALSSIIGSGSNSGGALSGVENSRQQSKCAEAFSLATSKGSGCASSFLNKTSSANSQQGNLTFLAPPLSFSASKSASPSPGDNKEHSN